MSAAFIQKGRNIHDVKIPTRDGGWIKRTTQNRDKLTARRMQRMIDDLGQKDARAWDVLDRLKNRTLTVPQLYDLWRECKQDVVALRAALRDADLEPMVEQYLSAASCSDDTKAHYRVYLRRLIPIGAPYPVGTLTSAKVQQLLDDMKGKSGTKRKAAAAVRSFCNWLISRGVLTINPVRDVRLPKAAAARVLYLETPDAIQLAEAQPSPYREFAALLAGSGIDVSTALRLRRRDVDVQNREIRASGTKTHARDRIVRVADWAWVYVLRSLEGKLPDARLFEEIPDRYKPGKVHREAIASLEEKYPIFRGYWMRDHRHTYAVRAIRAGTPADLVARQLGHANATLVLTVYGRFMPSQNERAKWERAASAMDKAKAKKEAGK